MTDETSDATVNLVALAYGVAFTPDRFEELLDAWDVWSDRELADPAAFEAISAVFEDALSAASRVNEGGARRSMLDTSAAPALLLLADRTVIATNTAAQSLLAEAGLDAARFLATSAPSAGSDKRRVYRVGGGPARRSFLAIETPCSDTLRAQHPDAALVVRLSVMDWNEVFASELATQFDLSAVELRITRGLLEGRTAQEIAGDNGRSVATVRTHIKRLLAKTGARRQSELVQFLTILRQVS